MMSNGKLIIVSGPSGTGKGTVLKRVFEEMPELVYSVSATSRKPREGEVDGVQYHFITRSDFEKLVEQNQVLEYAEYCGNYYGTPAPFISEQRALGKTVVLEIEPCGAKQVMEKCPDAITVFILPPSIDELERRLIGRGTESAEVVEKRISRARQELEQAHLYSHHVVNDDLEVAVTELINIIKNSI